METELQYITVKEAAKLLDVSPATLRNWDKAGKLIAHRDPVNGYRLYAIEDITKLIQEERIFYQVHLPLTEPAILQSLKRETTDIRTLRLLVRQMSQAFRDSMGGGLLERFEEISKLLYCKFYDEQQVLKGHQSRFYCRSNGTQDEIYSRIVTLYQKAIALLPEVFTNGHRELSEDKKAVVRVVEILQDIALSDIPVDIKGAVYEELIRNTFEKSDNQQFFTPRPVVEFMVRFTNPGVGQTICDPACGTGGFLIEASKRVSTQIIDTLTPAEVSNYLSNHIIGLEIDRRMAWIAQMNLIMHGEEQANIHYLSGSGSLAFSDQTEALIKPESLDLVLTNPPFGSDFSDSKSLRRYKLGQNKSSRRRGILFIERCIDWLKPGGRLGIVIEDSVLNGSSNKDVRHFMLQHCLVEAIISLPDLTFMPYASAKTSIVFLRKRIGSAKEIQKPIFMADVENVGRRPNGDPLYSNQRDPNGHYRLLNDLPDILEAWEVYNSRGEKAIAHLSPKVFICPADRFIHKKQEMRLDVQFQHPSRKIAEETLRKSVYPTPKLAELVIIRNVTAVPAKQDPDEFWRYVGLANITSETGEYTVSQVMGSQIKSAVRLFRPGDILFSKLRPELRKSILIRDDEDEGFVSSECIVFSTIEDALRDPSLRKIAQQRKSSPLLQVDSEYLALILRSDIVFGQLVYQITGIGRPRVSQSVILSLHIPLPPLRIQQEIVATYKMAWSHSLECRRRSEVALQEGDEMLRDAYRDMASKLCPPFS